jgi:hypothetical protein
MKRRVFGVLGVVGLLAAWGAVPATADDNGYNPPPAVADNCDAGHGAFGAFSHHFASYGGVNWIAEAAQQGGIGDTTGPTNSGFSEFCKTQ